MYFKFKKTLPIMMIVGGFIFSEAAVAVDVQIKITGEIFIPPCVVNSNNDIQIKFGNVSVSDVSNSRHRVKTVVPFTCSNFQGGAYVKVMGGGSDNVLTTDIRNLGIALYQGDGVSTKLLLGAGNGNGYKITTGLSGGNAVNGNFTFTAVPYKSGQADLSVGAFRASANMSITYL